MLQKTLKTLSRSYITSLKLRMSHMSQMVNIFLVVLREATHNTSVSHINM